MTPDILVKKMEALGRLCQQLEGALAAFDTVLDRENTAIARSDIHELESITQEKVAFGMGVEDRAQKIRKAIDEFAAYLQIPHSNEPIQLEEILHQLEKNLAGSFDEALATLGGHVKALAAERQRIFPKIEANAYMVKKLLQYHRETYAFWQAVASESEAVYGKTGKAVTAPKKSILTVRT
ncbi:MAG TPA: flagellar export chaperone FlgN [Oligoflexus sp.]|uniref:flagellar export chaperone FlgN n=1 Tax=Oligoflexus sp. TaxID=1971216 RepID=UPI002D7FBBF8|nr:flagellar export chaperone FlgN [Oligoflexus sp.]HET9240476.1 flagellar export chaperone FlgN [Oligoflexus sp.]